MKIIKKPIGLIILSSVLLNCGNNETEKISSEKSTKFCLDKTFKKSLETEQPVKKQVTQGIHLTGSVEPNPDKVIHFISLVGGIISNTSFSLGDKVNKGQVLAELLSTELSSLQAESKNLDSQIKVAEKNLQAVESMFKDGILSQKNLLEAQSELDILISEKQKITTNLNLFSASPEKGVFQIKAPASGIITAKSISAGTQISAESEPLFTISDLNEVWVMVNIYASNVKNIQEGIPVEIKTLSYPGEIFKGKITTISQVYDDEAKVLKARVLLPNTDMKLKPGMLVDIVAHKEQNFEAVSLSTKTLVFDSDRDFVVIYKSDCDLEIRKVEILSQNNGTTYISEGLNENEKVISKNQLLIYEQLKNF
jgi:cobalt-zinc-cadmium efflux system membrane fusion protein